MAKRIHCLFLGLLLLAVCACGPLPGENNPQHTGADPISPTVDSADTASVALARSWDRNGADSNTVFLNAIYDPDIWNVRENWMYPSTFDLVHRTLIGCTCSGSGPHGASPAWEIKVLDRPLSNETFRVLGVYDRTSSQLLFVLYQFDQPQRYYLVTVNLSDLSAEQQEQCIADAEVVLASFNVVQP